MLLLHGFEEGGMVCLPRFTPRMFCVKHLPATGFRAEALTGDAACDFKHRLVLLALPLVNFELAVSES